MVDYGNSMPTAPVPSPNAGEPGRGRAGHRELLLGHVLPALVAGVFVADQLALLSDSIPAVTRSAASATDWLTLLNRSLGLAFFVLMVVLFVVRLPGRGSDRRPVVVAVAMLGSYSILGGALLGLHVGAVSRGSAWVLGSDLLVATGGALSLWSLFHLRRSFSILPEARRLVVDGPYSFSRNPLYLGELIAGIGVLLPAFGPIQALALAVFVACQWLRIGWEERVLAAQMGADFAAYRAAVPRLVSLGPAFGRRFR